jgi:hypothetical protein
MRCRRIWAASRQVLDPPDQPVPLKLLNQAIALGTRAGTRQSCMDYRDRMEVLGLIETVKVPRKKKKGEKTGQGRRTDLPDLFYRFTDTDRLARMAQSIA